MTAPAKGWAVAVDGVYDVTTVSPHRRGALVNWLWGIGHMITNDYSDAEIEKLWEAEAPKHSAGVFEVWISEGQ